MGTHGAASTRPRALPPAQRATESAANSTRASRPGLNLAEWPVARRLFAVIVAALLMGLVLGGLRVADAEASATQFGRVSQLAELSPQLTVLVDDLQNERDATLGLLVSGDATRPDDRRTTPRPKPQVATVKRLAGGIGGDLPGQHPERRRRGPRRHQRSSASASCTPLLNPLAPANELAVIADYGADISDMITLSDQVAQGVADASLASDVRALNALSLAKEQVSQQRALLNYGFAESVRVPRTWTTTPPAPCRSRRTASSPTRRTFQQSATPAERAFFTDAMSQPDISLAQDVEMNVLENLGTAPAPRHAGRPTSMPWARTSTAQQASTSTRGSRRR